MKGVGPPGGTSLRFQATIRIRNQNPFVLVGRARAQTLRPGWRRPMPVLVRINGEPRRAPWCINLMPTGTGAFYLYLHGTLRRASATAVGDRVRVDLTFDAAYLGGPQHPIPTGLRAGLARSTDTRKAWKALTASRQKDILRYIAMLKSSEARERAIARTLRMLSAGDHRGAPPRSPHRGR